MAQNVNVYLGDFTKTGQKVQVDQWKTTITIQWINAAGVAQSRTVDITFPNDLALVPGAWLKEELLHLIMKAAFERLGVNA